MNRLTDPQLLRDYTSRRSEAAFAELVRRHVDLVYSAALRMVRDAHLAEDVTQGAFVALAQNARQLTDHPVLSGWLHRTTQNLAAKAVRTDVRRRAREQEAAAMNELLSAEPYAVWEHIAPQLDAALGELGEADRDALLLRYFERKSAREMAQTLGISDEAAQKRVNRAVERLREFFAKRGITVGASGLVVVITANAVQAAPVGLAVTISTAAALAGTTIAATATATTIKAIAMTTFQKTLVTATVAVLAGAGIYEARQASRLQSQVQTLQQQQAPLAKQVQQLQSEQNDATNRLSALADELERTKKNSSELLKLRAEVTRLRKEADTVVAEASTAKNFQAKVMQIFSNTPPIRTIVSKTETSATWDQTILTGGWRTPSGKRAMVLTTFQPGTDGQQLTINSTVLEYPEDAGKALGLAQFNNDGLSVDGNGVDDQAHKLNSTQVEAILKAAKDYEGVEILAEPSVTTANGMPAQITSLVLRQTPSGKRYSTGPVLNFKPTISPDGQSVQMRIDARLDYLIPVLRQL